METRICWADFEALSKLYHEDPQAFEATRLQLLNDAVAAAPVEYRPALRQTLQRIEAARLGASTPLEAAITASNMMYQSWGRLQTALHDLRHEVAVLQTAVVMERCKK